MNGAFRLIPFHNEQLNSAMKTLNYPKFSHWYSVTWFNFKADSPAPVVGCGALGDFGSIVSIYFFSIATTKSSNITYSTFDFRQRRRFLWQKIILNKLQGKRSETQSTSSAHFHRAVRKRTWKWEVEKYEKSSYIFLTSIFLRRFVWNWDVNLPCPPSYLFTGDVFLKGNNSF